MAMVTEMLGYAPSDTVRTGEQWLGPHLTAFVRDFGEWVGRTAFGLEHVLTTPMTAAEFQEAFAAQHRTLATVVNALQIVGARWEADSADCDFDHSWAVSA